MKKILALAACLIAASAAGLRADTTTTRMGLTKPSLGSSGWGTTTNNNWDITDSSAAIQARYNNFTASNTFSGSFLLFTGSTFCVQGSSLSFGTVGTTSTTFLGSNLNLNVSSITVGGIAASKLFLGVASSTMVINASSVTLNASTFTITSDIIMNGTSSNNRMCGKLSGGYSIGPCLDFGSTAQIFMRAPDGQPFVWVYDAGASIGNINAEAGGLLSLRSTTTTLRVGISTISLMSGGIIDLESTRVGVSSAAPVTTLGVGGGITASSSITANSGFYGPSATIATTLNVPNGSNPTLSAVGDVAYDTTDGTVLAFDGMSAKVVATATNTAVISISSGTGWNSLAIPVFTAPNDMAITITKITAETMPAGSTVTYQLDERAFGSLNTAGTNVFTVSESTANASGNTTTTSGFSNPGIAAGASLCFVTDATGSAGSPTWIKITIFYLKDRE